MGGIPLHPRASARGILGGVVKVENEDIVLSFPKNLVSSKYVSRFIERLEMEKIAQKSELSEEDAWKLSEEIKKSWWDKNRDRF